MNDEILTESGDVAGSAESHGNEELAPDELAELKERLAQAQRLLIQERNRRVFQRASEAAGIRDDRLEAAWKLAELDAAGEPIDEDAAAEIARKILAGYPEFSKTRAPLATDEGVPSKGRAKASGDALELLRMLRKE